MYFNCAREGKRSTAYDKVIVVVADNIEDVCKEAITGVILKNAYNLKETIEKNS